MKSGAEFGISLAAFLILAPAAWAQSVNGQVTRVSEAQGKITIRHGPIRNLDMDAMTMVFRAADPAMLKQVKPGDRIRFDVERMNGQLTVVRMEKVR